MKIDEFYTLTPEAACWTLTFEKSGEINPQTGKPVITRRQTFHATAQQALRRYCDNFLKDSTDGRDFLNRVELLMEKVDSIQMEKSK